MGYQVGGVLEDPVEEDLAVVLVLVLDSVVWGGFLHAVLKVEIDFGVCNQKIDSFDRALLAGDH